jgi:predicted N-acetyltransferase YhbS
MQELARRSWTPARRFHIGDLAWQRWSVPAGSVQVRQWVAGGEAVAGAWLETPGHLELLVDPERPDVVPAVLDWYEDNAAVTDRACTIMSADTGTAATLRGRGYVRDDHGPYFVRLVREVVDLPAPRLPPGFTITPVRPGQATPRAAVHRAGWSDFAAELSADDYAALMRTYPYRPDLDLVVVAPDGTWVASALGWYDAVNQVGLVEPVSCAPSHRRLGLGTAVNIALLHAFAARGATTAVTLPRGDDAYPVPRTLYQAIGYRPNGARTVRYRPEQ